MYKIETKKVNYKGLSLSPSAAGMRAIVDFTDKNSSTNGWVFWSYKDENGIEKTIQNLL